jgi:hypothetical protein
MGLEWRQRYVQAPVHCHQGNPNHYSFGGIGMAAIWGGLVIAPAMAAGFGAAIFLLVKYIVLKRKDSTRWGLITGPFWFFLVACVLTMSISKPQAETT